MIRATPKRGRDRWSKDPEREVDSLSLLLSWGTEGKFGSVSDEASDDTCVRDVGGLEPDSNMDEDIDRTWEAKMVSKMLGLLVACALMMLVLLWRGYFPMLAKIV